MTLVCGECGGPVEVQTSSGGAETGVFEKYECVDCGAPGTLSLDPATGETTLSGCLERA